MPTFVDGTKVPTPAQATFSKSSIGSSDVSLASNGVLKFLGCTVVGVSMGVGYNSSASSLQVQLVEDTDAGDSFENPNPPKVVAFSLPLGGIGKPVVYDADTLNALGLTSEQVLQPDAQYSSQVPFYFCGILTGIEETVINDSGRTIVVTIVDPREVLAGVQCLCGGFALSQEIGTGTQRYTDATNVIDCFGYFNYGLESESNEFGMPWNKIKTSIEDTKITAYGLEIEFSFIGSAFESAPDYYRIGDQVIDIVSLVETVRRDGGSDVITIARKISDTQCLVQFQAIKRTNSNRLTSSEIDNFINSRASIITQCIKTKEFKNEPTSQVIVGGALNGNYVAYPTSYASGWHLDAQGLEDFSAFPLDIKERMFTSPTVDAGAIFPYWGMALSGSNVPMAEPFLPLEHLAFDSQNPQLIQLKDKIPWCQIEFDEFVVREVSHDQVFLDGDDEPDSRPFAYVGTYQIASEKPSGDNWIKGLPLNTEILRAALQSEFQFYNVFALYYPDTAASIGVEVIDWDRMRTDIENAETKYNASSEDDKDKKHIKYNICITDYLKVGGLVSNPSYFAQGDGESDESYQARVQSDSRYINLARAFRTKIYEMVREYADAYCGRRFLVCLPRSEIMNRIWDGKTVPTNPERPDIEYVVAERGYWATLPKELNPDDPAHDSSTEEEHAAAIKQRFEMEDGRFLPMVFMDWKPKGNVCFNSNGINRAMFISENGGLSPSDFRPNRIAEGNPPYVAIACSVNQLPKRPDLAIVELPGAVEFDPTDSFTKANIYGNNDAFEDDELLVRKGAIFQLFKQSRQLYENAAWVFDRIPSHVVKRWSTQIEDYLSSEAEIALLNNNERVMDLKAVVIPLTSTWMNYGPWYNDKLQSYHGMVAINQDDGLVPWNFDRPPHGSDPYLNLNAAGEERLDRSTSDVVYIDACRIVVAGFPEMGLLNVSAITASSLNNLTGVNVSFGIDGVTTTYEFSTYSRLPGTFRKSEFDDISRLRVASKPTLLETENINLSRLAGFIARNSTNLFDQSL